MKCGRNRKWTSGSESMIQRRMARREKEGIALRGVAWEGLQSKGRGRESPIDLTKAFS